MWPGASAGSRKFCWTVSKLKARTLSTKIHKHAPPHTRITPATYTMGGARSTFPPACDGFVLDALTSYASSP